VLEENGMTGPAEEVNPGQLVPKMTREQAIKIIQKNERGRQGIDVGAQLRSLEMDSARRYRSAANGNQQTDLDQAAKTIQRCYRGFITRIKVKHHAREELVRVGMARIAPDNKDQAFDPVAKEQKLRQDRIARQEEHEIKYMESLADLRNSVLASEGHEMKDKMWDERFAWWIKQKEMTGTYPKDFVKFHEDRNKYRLTLCSCILMSLSWFTFFFYFYFIIDQFL
jgi:hypothetical protein